MTTESKPGYVYILTNPSFREDWVKIGKSSRPVDVRSKELDNTAVPLPFDIYATIQTVKYNEVEKLVHKTIDRLTDLRVRQNREFFNVPPSIALDIFRDIASTLDDAIINTYNNGQVTQITNRDLNRASNKLSVSNSKKNIFWEGYIKAIHNNVLFKKYFRISDGIPWNFYDLNKGNTLWYIFQAVTHNKISVGIYFNGKEQYRSFVKFKDEINEYIGTKAKWTESKKDATIVISKEFNLDDKQSYPETYFWMLNTAIDLVKMHTYAVQCIIADKIIPDFNDEPKKGETTKDKKTGQRPPFRFSMVGINIGEELTFIPTGIKVKVASDNQIEYEGRLYKLSPFTSSFMPAEKCNTSGAYQGPKFFTYKGKILNDMRTEKESKK